ncbi:MAG TPA: hypothetical protein PKA62_18315, partial [Thermoanaerobaculia bacterium]|nr:hypothetical protein [Thermoanaerobaculia bacterium]
STALLVPLVVLLPLAPPLVRFVRGEAAPAARGGARDRLLGVVAALGLAGLVVYGVYAFVLRAMPPALVEESVRGYLSGRPARPDEVDRYAALARAVPPLGHYLAGAKGVALLSERGRGANWFHGAVSEKGFPLYFPTAFLFKSTPAVLALLGAAAALGFARLRRGRVASPGAALAVLLALASSAALLVASMRSAFNIGARHLLPVWALLVFAGAVVFGRRLAARPRARAALASALVLSAGLSLRSAGDAPIAWFNVLAGGPEGGRRWFSDSNVDWGQDLYRLHLFLAERGWEEETTIVAFSGVATNYWSRKARVLDPAIPLRPGRYAVSHMMETLGEPFVRELEGEAAARQVGDLVRELRARGRRVAFVGGSITVWELPG